MASFEKFTEDFVPNLNDILDDVLGGGISQGFFLNQLAEDLKGKIVLRSRRGFGVRNFGGALYRFPRLSADYVEQRKTARSDGILSSRTSPRRSNITYTGDLIDGIRVANKEFSRIEFYFNTNANELKAFELHQNRRPFFFLSRSELNFTRTEINKELEKQIRIRF